MICRIKCILLFLLLTSSRVVATDPPAINFVDSYISSDNPQAHYDILHDIRNDNRINSFDAVLTEADSLEQLFHQTGNFNYLALAHSFRGDAYYQHSIYDTSAIHYMAQAESLLDLKVKLIDNHLIGAGYQAAAASLNMVGEKPKAIHYCRRALLYARKDKLLNLEADAHFVLSSAFYGLMQLDSSRIHLNKCYELDLLLKDTIGLINVQYMLGNLYSDQNKNEEALQMYRKALSEIPDSSTYEYYKISGFNYISQIHSKEGELDSALHYLNLALAVPSASTVTNINTKLNIKLAFLYLDMGKTELAYKAFKQIDPEQIVKDKSVLEFNYLRLCSNLNLKKGNLRASESCLLEALSTIEENNLETRKRALYPIAVKLYEHLKDPAKALSYSKELTAIIEELDSDELEKNILKTTYEFETKNLQNENEIIELENRLLDEKLRKRNSLSLFLVGFLLLSLASLYFYFKQTKAKEKLRTEVQKAVIEKKERQILEKDMQALRSQMNPHFMFNSLSSINHYIMNEDPRSASKYLTKFASLMRTILSNSKDRFVSLTEELKSLTLYTEIENLRYHNKYTFKFMVDKAINPDAFLMPPMLIQPYIENAIKHAFVGVDHSPQIDIHIIKIGSGIRITVEDNGIGKSISISNKSGQTKDSRPHSMDITESRLELISKLYNVESHLIVKDKINDEGQVNGTHISLHIPHINEAQFPL